jgi:5-formyltetrahydrofolate cyclo-ligase
VLVSDPSQLDPETAQLARLRAHAKRELRSRMRSIRAVLPLRAVRERSAAAMAQLRALPELAAARVVVGFSAIQRELDPASLLAEARAQGKRVGLPRVVESDDPAAPPTLSLHEVADTAELSSGAFGILEPAAGSPLLAAAEVDLVLVPGLAFDVHGHRIGYGRAFYDHLLPSMPRAFRVGVAYDFQLVPELPSEPHDIPMHCVVSDKKVLRVE